MVLTQSLFCLMLTVGGTVSALPQPLRDSGINLSIAAKLNFSGLTSIIEADRARAHRLKNHVNLLGLAGGKRQTTNVDVTNGAVNTLLIDTGSSNTWVGAGKKYVPTSSSKDTGKAVSDTYGGGAFSGEEYTDKVDLGNGLVINSQSIGVANETRGFSGQDGILGIGPTDLTRGSIEGSDETVPTVVDNLASQGTIGSNAVGMFFAPYEEDASGVLTFGGADSSLYTGDLHYTSVTKTSPANQYWGVDQSISYGNTNILSQNAGIIDSGTSMILLASDAYEAYQKATGAVEDQRTGFLTLSKEQYGNLQPLNFNIGGNTFALSANGQIWPRSLNTAFGGDEDSVYLVIGDLGSQSGDGFDFINGYTFMERFYAVFDTTNSRIGLANTQYTNSESN
ncbi:hypothetical protein PHLCEN_2v5476 [Hermanssonia centrifuga]|uniref:Peptidase A1 domain-containing protein n=1 Tax=Hermanssonia centrifuga TaxID=98765 RepID=A0A2R6P279_9APHY|nr:hypothetical protein PHLCEN_2v5476 [Hermanssonia centrifuga]